MVLLAILPVGCSDGPTDVTEHVSLAVSDPEVVLYDGRVIMSAN